MFFFVCFYFFLTRNFPDPYRRISVTFSSAIVVQLERDQVKVIRAQKVIVGRSQVTVVVKLK